MLVGLGGVLVLPAAAAGAAEGDLSGAGIEHVVLMGGTAALSDAVEQAVEDLGIDVSRVAGSTRYGTAVKAAELAEDQYSAGAGMTCFANDTLGVARARVPFDSFSAAPLLGRLALRWCSPTPTRSPTTPPPSSTAPAISTTPWACGCSAATQPCLRPPSTPTSPARKRKMPLPKQMMPNHRWHRRVTSTVANPADLPTRLPVSPCPAGQNRRRARCGLQRCSWISQMRKRRGVRRRKASPDGYTYWWDAYALQLLEMLAWSRFQLGWLGDEQVWCVDNGEASVTLAPVAQPGGRAAVAVVPMNSREVIVVESRRNLGYDRGTPLTWPRGDTTNRRALLHEGVLVYTVDASVPSGQLPMRIAGDKGDGQVAGFPVIEVGESVTLHGYTITVTADDGSTHTVSITRNS